MISGAAVVQNTGATIWDFLISMRIPLGLIIFAIGFAFCIKYANNLLSLSGAVAGVFAKFSKGAQKKQISASIRSSVIKAAKPINSANPEILPSDLKINWAEKDDIHSFFDDNCVVVRLKREADPNANYVKIIHCFVSSGLFKGQRQYFNDETMKASEVLLTQKIVKTARPSANKFFYDHIYMPEIAENEQLSIDYDYLKGIDLNGMLFNVYLNELAKAATNILGEIPDPCLKAESGEFLRFLYQIASREKCEINDLNFKRSYFQIAIVLAANAKTLRERGWGNHFHLIKKLLDQGYRTIYILAIGSNSKIASRIAVAVKSSDERVVRSVTHEYRHTNATTGVRMNAICIELDTY